MLASCIVLFTAMKTSVIQKHHMMTLTKTKLKWIERLSIMGEKATGEFRDQGQKVLSLIDTYLSEIDEYDELPKIFGFPMTEQFCM